MKTLLKQNQNETGGGLATEITGKFESNRNALAKLDQEKRTAGEVASSLRKKGYSIYAKDIKEFMEEWHHAGKLPKHLGGGMAKAYYTKKSDEDILQLFEEKKEKLKKENAENERLSQIKAYYAYYTWESEWGRKGKFKVLRFAEGTKLEVREARAIELTKEEFEKFKHHEGKKYFGWDEPTYDEIITFESLEEGKRRKRNARRRELYRLRKIKEEAERREKEKKERIENLLSSKSSDENVLRLFFQNEVHPAPAKVVELKNKSGLSWNVLREIYLTNNINKNYE